MVRVLREGFWLNGRFLFAGLVLCCLDFGDWVEIRSDGTDLGWGF